MEQATEIERKPKDFITGSPQDIPNRRLREAVCAKFGYTIGDYQGERCHIANYRDPKTGRLVAQKIRRKDKKFTMLGDGKGAPFFGQHLYHGGKSLVITEGEIDALSIAQVMGEGKWPVVSLPNGAQSAKNVVEAQYEWLDSFEQIILCFDQDEPGRKATEEVLPLLPPGKAYVMTLPHKDANETLIEAGGEAITQAFWNKQPWKPDGVRSALELREAVLNPKKVPTIPYRWSGFNDRLGGLREGELVTLTAGSGIGKSTVARELAYHLGMKHEQRVGLMFLEESNARTMEGLMSIDMDHNLVTRRDEADAKALAQSFDRIANTERFYLWDHFGSNDVDDVIAKLRYMVKALGCRWLFLDHLSILVSGIETGDERKTIDVAMTKLRTFVSETNAGLVLISHLKRPSGDKGHEDGAAVHLGQLRGSHSIAQLSDAVIGFQKSEDNDQGIEPVVLKNRWSGNTGSCGVLYYDRDTSRLAEGFC